MTANKPIVVFDPYKLFPPYGENSITFSYMSMEFILNIFFDSKDSDTEEKKIVIRFTNCCFFLFTSIPGIEMTSLIYETNTNIGSLVDYKESEAAKNWNTHFGYNDQRIKHYQIFFLSDNSRLELFAQNFIVTTGSGL